MKRLIYLILLALVAFTAYTQYAWADVSVRAYNVIAGDSEQIVQNGYGLQVNYHFDKPYLYISADKNPVRFGGQSGQDVWLGSAGVGVEHDFKNGFKVALALGWYEPFHDDSKQFWTDHESPLVEGLHYYLNGKLQPLKTVYWDWYSIQYSGALGGKVGATYSHTFKNGWNLGGGLFYRYLRLGEMVKGGNKAGNLWWEYKENRDFSGAQVSAQLNIPF